MEKWKRRLKSCFDDKLYWGVILAFVLLIVLSALFVPIPAEEPQEHLVSMDGYWNTQRMEPAEGVARQDAENIYQVKRVFAQENEFPKGLKVDKANVQGEQVLVVFDRYRDMNVSLNRDYVAVYDTAGQWLYGFEGVLLREGDGVEIALSPEQEGILFLSWKLNETGQDVVLLVKPDGSRQAYAAELSEVNRAAYWKSAYKVSSQYESRLILANRETGEQTEIFDYSEEYKQMYPYSSRIAEEDQWMYDALVLIGALILMLILLPKIADNPELSSRGRRKKAR